jgi:lipoate-protein ligase A
MSELYVSQAQDPIFHLAVEDWLLRHSGETAFFLYQNKPSVVLGRFQNPWLECDLAWLADNQVQLVRRFSGGGTVWHDLGNVNFCWVGPLAGFKKTAALEVVRDRLAELGVIVEINARHDLVVRQSDGSTRKVSGSAFKQTKDRALHHGTLLLQGSDLSKLNRALTSPHTLSETRSIASVRSVVQGLPLTPKTWMESWGKAKIVEAGDERFADRSWGEWPWRMGETPLFRWSFALDGHEISLSAHKGMIQELSWRKLGIEVSELGRRLEAATFNELAEGQLDQKRWESFLGV